MSAGPHERGWSAARALLRDGFIDEGIDPAAIHVGRVRTRGEGLTYRTWGGWVDIGDPDAVWPSGEYVVRIPHEDAELDQPARAQRESELLEALHDTDLEARLPEAVALIPSRYGLAFIQTDVAGIALPRRHARLLDLVADAIAACHSVTVTPAIERALEGYDTAQRHLTSHFKDSIKGLDMRIRELRVARELIHANVPVHQGVGLVHGDLLPQNVLLGMDDSFAEPLGIIDWSEATIGSLAYEIAIVTRGRRQPLGLPNGFRRLVAAVEARLGQNTVDVRQVRLHELALLVGFYQAEVEDFGDDSDSAEDALERIHKLLRRLAPEMLR